MVSFLRHRQRAFTALSAHQGNRDVLIPKRPTSSLRFRVSVGKDGDLRGLTPNVGTSSRVALDGQVLEFMECDIGNDAVELVYAGGAQGLMAAATGYFLTDSLDGFVEITSLPWNGAQTRYKAFNEAARTARWDAASPRTITVQLEIIP